MINALRKNCPGEVFSYTFLIDHLQAYVNPRGKINRMLQAGEITRIKKGLYVFGEDYRRAPIQHEILANLIYGPSYVSGLYALAQHGFIPERVETVTNMTTQRNAAFNTPFGQFEYTYLNQQRYTVGIYWRKMNEREHCLFATPEKALVDTIARERDLVSTLSLENFLFENLRIDEEMLINLSLERLSKITAVYGSPVIRLLNDIVGRMY